MRCECRAEISARAISCRKLFVGYAPGFSRGSHDRLAAHGERPIAALRKRIAGEEARCGRKIGIVEPAQVVRQDSDLGEFSRLACDRFGRFGKLFHRLSCCWAQMDLSTWVAFALLETFLCLTPGPAVLFVVGSTLGRGRPGGFAATAGIVAGNTVYFVLSATSLGAILLASYQVFTLVRWVGAAYLVFLGVRMLW